jgi:exosortase
LNSEPVKRFGIIVLSPRENALTASNQLGLAALRGVGSSPPVPKRMVPPNAQDRVSSLWRTFGGYWRCTLLAAAVLLLYFQVLVALVGDWYGNPDYSHGFFVPILSAYLIWRKRETLHRVPVEPSFSGFFVVLSSVALLFLGSLGAELFLTRIAFVATIAGLVVYFLGWATLRAIIFPLMLLLLMIPLPTLIYNEIVFPLQFVASSFATGVLDTLNLFPVMREGNILVLPHNRIEVVEACSGIRSLMSLITLALSYGYFAERNRYVQILLVVAMVPLAVVSNGFRVVGTALLTHYWGPRMADGFLHSFSGWVIFIVAAVLLLMLHAFINVIRRAHGRGLEEVAVKP